VGEKNTSAKQHDLSSEHQGHEEHASRPGVWTDVEAMEDEQKETKEKKEMVKPVDQPGIASESRTDGKKRNGLKSEVGDVGRSWGERGRKVGAAQGKAEELLLSSEEIDNRPSANSSENGEEQTNAS